MCFNDTMYLLEQRPVMSFG